MFYYKWCLIVFNFLYYKTIDQFVIMHLLKRKLTVLLKVWILITSLLLYYKVFINVKLVYNDLVLVCEALVLFPINIKFRK